MVHIEKMRGASYRSIRHKAQVRKSARLERERRRFYDRPMGQLESTDIVCCMVREPFEVDDSLGALLQIVANCACFVPGGESSPNRCDDLKKDNSGNIYEYCQALQEVH